MFNINWSYIVRVFTPTNWRFPITLAWLEVLISQVKALHTTFLSWKTVQDRYLFHNGQTIYLEKLLNDLFDNANRGIYIDTVSDSRYTYLFNKSEAQPPKYVYNKWKSLINYSVDDRVNRPTGTYKCLVSNSGNTPETSPTYWVLESGLTYLFNKSELYSLTDFIVYVPLTVTATNTDIEAIVNRFKIAGKIYTIQFY